MPELGGSRELAEIVMNEVCHCELLHIGSLSLSFSEKMCYILFNLSCSWFKVSCDCTPTVESKLTFLSYFGSPFSSWIPLPNCSHHGGRFQRSPSEGQGADGLWCSPSGTSNSHSRLSRVSIRFQNKQSDKKIPWPSYNFWDVAVPHSRDSTNICKLME